ncbi:MAG: reverse transcriptase family protein, partial [Candidatus Thiodiazotropha sp.]
MDGKVHNSSTRVLDGWYEHFKSLATPSTDGDFDKGYASLVDMEMLEIVDMCGMQLSGPSQCVTVHQVQEAIQALNRGKAADVYGLTAEHFLYGGDDLLMATTDIINALFRFGKLTEALKVGVLTPVFKKKGSSIEAKNYRGITILPTITKILETVLRQKIRPSIENNQNSLQRGFTQNSSPMNCSLILEEVIREYKDKRQPLYIAFLDAKSAFDVVSHNSLMRKLYHIGIDGPEWLLVHSLHEGAESVVKWEGSVSEKFKVGQGVRQGGILSTDLYKVYGNILLDRITSTGIGCYIGNVCCAAPTAADDMAILAPSLSTLQKLVSIAVDYSRMERYLLQ